MAVRHGGLVVLVFVLPAKCLAAMCTVSERNRELTLTRDTVEALIANIRRHMANADVVLGVTQSFCQLLVTSSAFHTPQFSRAIVDCVLDGRRSHPGNADVHLWTLTFLHNITAVSDEHRVFIARHFDGLSLLLDARDARLRGELPIGLVAGPGQATVDLCLEIAPARIPRY